MTWLIFVASCLATFRLTRLITDDKIMDFVRDFVRRETKSKKAKQGITCPFCVSFYYATFITVGLWWAGLFPSWQWILFWQPAIWGGSVIFNQLFCRLTP